MPENSIPKEAAYQSNGELMLDGNRRQDLAGTTTSMEPERDDKSVMAAKKQSSAGDRDTSNASPVRIRKRSSRPSRTPVPPAAVAATPKDNVSKVDLAIMGLNATLVGFPAANMEGLPRCWETQWKMLYYIPMMVSAMSTLIGVLTAASRCGWCPAVSWATRFSPTCTRLGLVMAAVPFTVFIAGKVGFGCPAGVASAAFVVAVLVVVWAAWSKQQPTTGPVEQAKAALPADAP